MARRPSLLSPSAYIRRRGVYDGFLGGRRGWAIAGGVFWGARLLRKALGRNEETIGVETLKPGQFVTVTAIAPTSRRARRAARRG